MLICLLLYYFDSISHSIAVM